MFFGTMLSLPSPQVEISYKMGSSSRGHGTATSRSFVGGYQKAILQVNFEAVFAEHLFLGIPKIFNLTLKTKLIICTVHPR